MHSPHLELAKKFWTAHLAAGDWVVDATCGQGRDTLFLCQLGCEVVGLDIQPKAIQLTEALLKQHGWKAQLYLTSHACFPPLLRAPKLIVYNLGYLPGGDKNLTTQTSTTLASLSQASKLISKGGALSIMCYPGHPEGAREEEAILEMIGKLDSQTWIVSHHRWLNRPINRGGKKVTICASEAPGVPKERFVLGGGALRDQSETVRVSEANSRTIGPRESIDMAKPQPADCHLFTAPVNKSPSLLWVEKGL